MAKCSNCGRSGLFLKLKDGLCNDCIAIAYQRAEIEELKQQKTQLQKEIAHFQNALYQLKKNHPEFDPTADPNAGGFCTVPDRSALHRSAAEQKCTAVESQLQAKADRAVKKSTTAIHNPTQRCDKCHRSGLETEIEFGSVCNACRKKYPRIRDSLAESSQTYQKWFYCNLDYIRDCRRRFIAFDLETTGLSAYSDRIIELSAVVFENFKPVAEFSTLVNPERRISPSASAVNGISDEDVKDAPYIHEAIENFCDFIGADALNGDIPMVAHNADFDIKFLLTAFQTCGVNANIFLQDTLYMSRWMNPDLPHHKLADVARHFGICQQNAHRTFDDARVCGEVFSAMLLQRERRLTEKKDQLLPIELEFCQWLKSECEAEDLNTQLYTVKSAKTFCAVKCVAEVLRIKARGKSPYIIVSKDCPVPDGLSVSDTTKSEGEENKRLHFVEASDLYPLRNYFVDLYRRISSSSLKKINSSMEQFQFASEAAAHEISL